MGEGEISSSITYAVENNVDVHGYAAIIGTGKMARHGSEIRSINGNGILVDRGTWNTAVGAFVPETTGSTMVDTVVFNNLVLIHAPTGPSLTLKRAIPATGIALATSTSKLAP